MGRGKTGVLRGGRGRVDIRNKRMSGNGGGGGRGGGGSGGGGGVDGNNIIQA